tara:strand:- start:1001 stop:1693 length:693 start_codon:yes stop_codon:yes gene_type:complete
MDNSKNKTFLIIKSNYFALNVISDDLKILFSEDFFYNISEKYSISLLKFLDDKIFKVEKEFNCYIKDIYLIIKDKNFIKFDVSLIKDFKNTFDNTNDVLSEISNIKETILKSNSDHKLIHMMINRFIIDGNEYLELPNINSKKNLFLEIKFICLSIEKLFNIKKILSEYQINIKKTFNYEYVKSFKKDDSENLSLVANKLDNGLNSNEINFIEKNSKSIGFFEKFFKFFG